MSMTENKALETALEKVKAQKVNFGFLERFDVDENWEVTKALEEIQQYRAIGNVEELRELKEKATAKKPIVKRANNINFYICPTCGKVLTNEILKEYPNSCVVCRQSTDWSEGKE